MSITHIVSYSGGIGSAITADMICKEYGKDNVVLLFADTLIEDNDLYRFNIDVINLLRCRFERIAEGRTTLASASAKKQDIAIKHLGNADTDPLGVPSGNTGQYQ